MDQRWYARRHGLFTFLSPRFGHEVARRELVILFAHDGTLWLDDGGYTGQFERIICHATIDERFYRCGRGSRLGRTGHIVGRPAGPHVAGVRVDSGVGAGGMCRRHDESLTGKHFAAEP